MNIWIKWQIEIIEADHGGYCSGADNIEKTSYDTIYCKYTVDENEYYTLIWINNECSKTFDDHLFIEAIKPTRSKK